MYDICTVREENVGPNRAGLGGFDLELERWTIWERSTLKFPIIFGRYL